MNEEIKSCTRCSWHGVDLFQHRFCPECYTPIWQFQAKQNVGPYILERILGVGGFAEVWLASHRQLGINRALKRLRLEELLTHWQPKSIAEFQQRFVREAQLQAKLYHPNIIQVYELAEWEHEIWMVMEYCSKGNLLQHIQNHRLNLHEAIDITVQILKGLEFAHNHNVVHRDIKPSNVLQNEHNDWQIGDFGIAKVASDLHLTQGGSRMGTPYYMAPEQWRDPSSVGFESDIYSVGCILFQMLEGTPPFEGESMAEVMEKHLVDKVPPMKNAPEWLESVVIKSMDKIPHKRFRSAAMMLEALKEAKRLDISTGRMERAEVQVQFLPYASMNQHSSWITGVAFHPHLPIIASGSNDWTLCLYDIKRKRLIQQYQNFYSPVLKVCYHPDGHLLAVGELRGQITLLDPNTGKESRKFRVSEATTAMLFDPTGKYLVTGHFSGRVMLWNLEFGVQAFDQLFHKGEIRGMAFSPGGERWVTVGEDEQIVFWQTRTGEIEHVMRSISGRPECVAWHPQGRYVAVGTQAGVIDVFDTQHWQVAFSFQHADLPVLSLEFHPKGQYLASAGADGVIIIWQAPIGFPLTKITAHQGPILTMNFHPKQEYFASGGVDCLLRLWRISITPTTDRHSSH